MRLITTIGIKKDVVVDEKDKRHNLSIYQYHKNASQ